jgi:hypothetical protein
MFQSRRLSRCPMLMQMQTGQGCAESQQRSASLETREFWKFWNVEPIAASKEALIDGHLNLNPNLPTINHQAVNQSINPSIHQSTLGALILGFFLEAGEAACLHAHWCCSRSPSLKELPSVLVLQRSVVLSCGAELCCAELS